MHKTTQDIVKHIMGYLPDGYVIVCEQCNGGTRYRTGMVYVDGKPVCGFNMKEVI